METKPCFLEHSERAEFDEPGRAVSRSIVEITSDEGTTVRQNKVPLGDAIVREVEKLIRENWNWFRCFTITVEEDDGMSWSAERVNAIASERYPQYTRWCLLNQTTTGRIPQIAGLIGERSFLNLAATYKLAPQVYSLAWSSVMVIGLSVAVGVLVKVVDALLKLGTPTAPQPVAHWIGDPLFYVSATVSVLLATVAQWLTGRMVTLEKSKEAFIKSEGSEFGSPAYDAFVGSLAEAISRSPFPRFVIIDNFHIQDRTTKRVIERYFEERAREAGGSEFWVVFDRRGDGDLFTSRVLEHRNKYGSQKHSKRYYGYSRSGLYQQLLLTGEEKRELAKFVGRPESAAEFTTVKYVCHEESEGEQRFKQVLLDARKRELRNPDRYGSLDFLYLLALTATPGNVSLDRKFLRIRLSEKHGLRADVLSQFLRGTKWLADEFQGQLTELVKSFSSLLIFEEDGGATQLRVRPEAAQALQKLKGELELPPAGVGHLFWSLLWHDAWRNQPVQAFWIRKLAYHVGGSDLSQIPAANVYERIAPRVARQLLDISLDCVDGALQSCCLLKTRIDRDKERSVQTSIPDLLRKAHLLMSSIPPSDQPDRRKKLIAKCWSTYFLLNDKDIVGLIEELPASIHVVEKPDESPLQSLFFDSLPFSSISREEVRAIPLEPAAGEAGRAVQDFAIVRSAWLALAVRSMFQGHDATCFAEAAKQADEILEGVANRVCQRLKTDSAEATLALDLMSLSQSLWCHALLANPSLQVFLPLVVSKEEDVALLSALPPAELPGTAAKRRFEVAVQLVERSIKLAAEIRKRAATSQARVGTDFTMSGLAREVAGIAVASLLTAYHYQRREGLWDSMDSNLLDTVSAIFRSAEDVLDSEFPAVRTMEDLASSQLLQGVDETLRFIGTLWVTFDLAHLRDLLSLRRVHFNAICRHLAPEDTVSYRPLLESEAHALNQSSFAGLMARCSLSDCFSPARDLSAYHACAAARIVLLGSFGARLKREFSRIAVAKAHNVNHDLAPFLTDLLEREGGGETALLRMLRSVPPSDISRAVLEFSNACAKTRNEDLSSRVRHELDSAVETLPSGAEKREARALLEFFVLQDQIGKGEPVEQGAVLRVWSDRADLWMYASVLRLLLSSGHLAPEVQKASLDALRRDPWLDIWNSHFLLALQLAEHLVYKAIPDRDSAVVLAYLRKGIKKWEDSSSADTNVHTYEILSLLDAANRPAYRPAVVKWRVIQMERDQQTRLPQLIEQGLFFLVFQDCCRSMKHWGLDTDTGSDRLYSQRNLTADRRKELAQQWKQMGSNVPQPIVRQGPASVVSGEFLSIGEWLFSSPLEQDSNFDDERNKFNQAAAQNLQNLLSLAVNLANLPPSIRELLQAFSRRLYDFSLPIERKAAAARGAA